MSRIGLAAFIGCTWFAAAPAAADTIENLFGNTLLVTYPSGTVERFFIDADGTFTMEMYGERIDQPIRWTRDGDQFCVVLEGRDPDCSDFPADKTIGDTWEVARPDGQIALYEIVAGR